MLGLSPVFFGFRFHYLYRLEQMFSLTVGCNLGTTVTAIMAAMVSEGSAALQVALAHLFFNVSGIVLFFIIPVSWSLATDASSEASSE